MYAIGDKVSFTPTSFAAGDNGQKVYYLNARDDVVIKAPITRVTHWMPLPQPPKEG